MLLRKITRKINLLQYILKENLRVGDAVQTRIVQGQLHSLERRDREGKSRFSKGGEEGRERDDVGKYTK